MGRVLTGISQPFVKTLSKEHVLSETLHVYRKLASDDQDSVRLLTVQDLIAIAQRLEPSEVRQELLTQIRQSAADKSWRVRYMVANHFVEVSRRSGEMHSSNFCLARRSCR